MVLLPGYSDSRRYSTRATVSPIWPSPRSAQGSHTLPSRLQTKCKDSKQTGNLTYYEKNIDFCQASTRLVWLIKSREWEFRDRSLEIFCLFCGNETFGEKVKGSLEGQLPLINSQGEGWELGGSCVHSKRKVDHHWPS